MSEQTIVIEEEAVVIKQEHAYASKDETNVVPVFDSIEDDPLQIMASDVDRIKCENDCEIVENVEIKVEPDLGHLVEHNDMDTTEYNRDILTTEMEISESSLSVDDMFYSGEFVPKAAFMDLQNKYKQVHNNYVQSIADNQTFTSENKALKNEINKLKKETRTKFTENFRQLKRDLGGAHLMGNNLKYEINCLAKQNLFLRNKLMECSDVAKYEQTMENTVLELKNKFKNFLDKENKSHQHFSIMKTQLESKEREHKIIANKLHRTILQLETIKHKVFEQSKMRALFYESKKQRDKLQKELTDCMKVRYLYEDHADLIKREMNVKLKEKEMENERYKKEIDNLSKICLQHETALAGIKEKYKTKNHALEAKIADSGKMYVHEKQKAASLQEKVIEKHNENVALKKEVDALKSEIEQYQAANLEAKVNQKQRENVMLREEVAILKVELEKIRPKYIQ